jgi:autotransporter-associated beta strand protein/T5SS/PEP-CTERM-associated repeat protein
MSIPKLPWPDRAAVVPAARSSRWVRPVNLRLVWLCRHRDYEWALLPVDVNSVRRRKPAGGHQSLRAERDHRLGDHDSLAVDQPRQPRRQVGSTGTGTLNITGGGTVTNTFGKIGFNTGSTGAASWISSAQLRVGESGQGTLNITGGGAMTSSLGFIGFFSGSNGHSECRRRRRRGDLEQFGGVDRRIERDRYVEPVQRRVGFGPPPSQAATPPAASTSTAARCGSPRPAPRATRPTYSSAAVRSTCRPPASTFTLTGVVAGSGTLTKTGPGTLVINGTGTNFTGGVTVNAGRLDIINDPALGTATLGAGPLGTIRYTTSDTVVRTFNLAGGSLEVPTDVTLGLGGATIAGGFIVGSGTVNTLAVTSNRFVGNTTSTATNLTLVGADTLTNFTNGGLLLADALTSSILTRFTNTTSGRMVVSSTVNVSKFVSNGIATINAGGAINNSGSNFILGGGSRATIDGAGALATAPRTTIELNGGLLVNNGTISGTVNVNFGSVAKDSGTYGVVNVDQGGIYAPGNSRNFHGSRGDVRQHAHDERRANLNDGIGRRRAGN